MPTFAWIHFLHARPQMLVCDSIVLQFAAILAYEFFSSRLANGNHIFPQAEWTQMHNSNMKMYYISILTLWLWKIITNWQDLLFFPIILPSADWIRVFSIGFSRLAMRKCLGIACLRRLCALRYIVNIYILYIHMHTMWICEQNNFIRNVPCCAPARVFALFAMVGKASCGTVRSRWPAYPTKILSENNTYLKLGTIACSIHIHLMCQQNARRECVRAERPATRCADSTWKINPNHKFKWHPTVSKRLIPQN